MSAPAIAVLVIGASGVSGRRILQDLHWHGRGLRLAGAGRATAAPALPPGVEWLQLDINQLQPAQLAGFNLVIMAAGPFEQLRERVHRACIDAGADCIDINDSYDAAEAIFALDAAARAAGVRVISGAGLSPGLSGLLLAGLRSERPQARRFDSLLYLGAKNGGGASAPLALLSGFRRQGPQWRGGRLVLAATDWRGLRDPFLFPHSDKALPCVPQLSPELAALAHGGGFDGELRHRFHVQGLPPALAKSCATLGLAQRPRLAHWLAARMFAAGNAAARKPASSPFCSLLVRDRDSGAHWRVHGEIAAYHLTASVAACIALALLNGELKPAPGVHAPEALGSSFDWQGALAERGIVVERGAAAAPRDWPTRLGASSEAQAETASLRHYGQCWYSVAIPPWVQRWQWRCLADSELFAAIRRRHGLLGRGGLLLRLLRDWRRDLRRVRALGLFGPRESSAQAAAMRRDFCLFAAGYRRLRRSLGPPAAELYARMFLDTGAMEMHWLTPSAAVFAARPDPLAALADYIAAYYRAYVDLAAVAAHISRTPQQLQVVIQRCVFAQIFNALDVAELAPLVRRMEQVHFGAIAAQLGAQLIYHDDAGGLARYALNLPPAAPAHSEVADEYCV